MINKNISDYSKLLTGDMLFEKSITAMMIVDSKRTIIKANKQFFTLFNHSASAIIGFDTSILTPSNALFEQYKKHFEQTLDGAYKSRELLYKKRNGTLFWVKLTGIPIKTDIEEFILWSFDDINEEVVAREEIQNRYRELDIIFSRVKVGIVYEVKGIIERVNRFFLAMVDKTEGDVVGKETNAFPEFFAGYKQTEHKKLLMFNDKYGIAHFIERDVAAIDTSCHTLIFSNVTGHIQENKRLQIMAQTDGLTQIFNRTTFIERAQQMLLEKHAQTLSFVMCDIDNFKQINDLYGHNTGDNTLFELTSLISKQLRQGELFGRIGGEEFGIMLPVGKEAAVTICERLLAVIRNHTFTGKKLHITVSMGLIDNSLTDNFDAIYINADKMLYKSKNNGKDQVNF